MAERPFKMQEETNVWRTFSIFISSTFADMQAERDMLNNIVFPKLEEELLKKRIKLETVDLRWGVDTGLVKEDERETTVLKVCLNEIKRCRPFFIGLLGDRYGWIPDEKKIKDAIYEAEGIKDGNCKSVTALEIEFGVLSCKEQLVRSVFYLRLPLPYNKMNNSKAALFCDDFDSNLTEAEKQERKTALNNLKKNIFSYFDDTNLKDKVRTYSGTWNEETERVTGLESWGDMVFSDILAECENHAKETWDQVPQNKLGIEKSLLDSFIEEHTHISTVKTEKGEEQVPSFCGRKKLIEDLKKHLLSTEKENWGIVITGESGTGKSAVFAMMFKIMMKEDCFILAHSAGISAEAKSIAELLRKWNRELIEFIGINEAYQDEFTDHGEFTLSDMDIQKTSPKSELERLQEQFSELLFHASVNKKVILLIDALDLFESSPRAQYMTWLPKTLPAGVRVLVTAITGSEKYALQYHKGLSSYSLDHFSEEDGYEMLISLCKRKHKSLPSNLVRSILSRTRKDGLMAASSPLWLSLAVNVLMAIDTDDFERMRGLQGIGVEQIENYLLELSNKFPALPGDLFLNLVEKAGDLFGYQFTRNVFNYIACSRNGLREKDLEILIAGQTSEIWDSLRFANLRRWFRVHFVEQGVENQWNLSHSILRNTLRENISSDEYSSLNFSIASYLLTLPDNDSLRTSETMYHLLESDKLKEAAIYYGEIQTEEQVKMATATLAESIISADKGMNRALQLPHLISNHFCFYGLYKKYISELNDALEEAGNLNQRLSLMLCLNEILVTNFENTPLPEDFKFDRAVLFGKLGTIYQDLGQYDKAIEFYNFQSKLMEEINVSGSESVANKWGLAISYQHLGIIYQLSGQYNYAVPFLELYNQLMEELAADYPRSEGIINGLAISYERLGYIFQKMGQLDKAVSLLKHRTQLGKLLYDHNKNNSGLKFSLAVAFQLLGNIYLTHGKTEEALQSFTEMNTLCRELYESNPKSEKIKNGLAISYEQLGNIYQIMGNFDKALEYITRFSHFSKEIFEANPNSEKNKISYAISHQFLGDLYKELGKPDKALEFFNLYNKSMIEFYNENPESEDIKSYLANSYQGLASLYKSLGLNDYAIINYNLHNQLIKELSSENPKNEKFTVALAVSYKESGSLFQQLGQYDKALESFYFFMKRMKEILDNNPKNEELKLDLAISYHHLGNIYQLLGQVENAVHFLELYNQLMKELSNNNPERENLKVGLAGSYEELGQIFINSGDFMKALEYLNIDRNLSIELYKVNPKNANLLEGLCVSHYKLANAYYQIAMAYKSSGDHRKGKENLQQYNKIVEDLSTYPEIPKYSMLYKKEY